ncbi:hypothetical protein D3C75_1029160 [compost metagenome]
MGSGSVRLVHRIGIIQARQNVQGFNAAKDGTAVADKRLTAGNQVSTGVNQHVCSNSVGSYLESKISQDE